MAGWIVSPWSTAPSSIGWLKLSRIAWVTGTRWWPATGAWTFTSPLRSGRATTEATTTATIARPASPRVAPSGKAKRRGRILGSRAILASRSRLTLSRAW